jgi:hypothetical protein
MDYSLQRWDIVFNMNYGFFCLATLAYHPLELSNRELCGFCSISRTCRVVQISFSSVRRFPRPFTLPVMAVEMLLSEQLFPWNFFS